jgi:hypothetical protein
VKETAELHVMAAALFASAGSSGGGPEGNGVVNTVTGVHGVICILALTKLGDLMSRLTGL